MEGFDQLVNSICAPHTDQATRAFSERRLVETLEHSGGQWRNYMQFLFTANDTGCFFICIGLQRLIWRHWREFSTEEQTLLTQTVIQAITTRADMPHFVKSKLEQVLAAICAASCSLQPALSLVVDADQPGCSAGVSLMRTVLDVTLADDAKILPDQKVTLMNAVTGVLVPLTNLAVSACKTVLHNATDAATGTQDQRKSWLLTSIDLLKIIVVKVPIGPHITVEVVDLLFNVSEFGAQTNSPYAEVCVSSFEVLTELMSKKFMPPSMSRLDIAMRAVALLQKYRLGGCLDVDSNGLVPLLDFISSFADSHLHFCLTQGAAASSSADGNINAFFEEFVMVVTSSKDPALLARLVSVWNRLMRVNAAKERMIMQPTISVQVVSHLFQCCLTQSNSELAECLDELIEDVRLEAVVDPHLKEMLAHLSAASTSCSPTSSSSFASGTGVGGSGNGNSSSGGSSNSKELGAVDLEFAYVGTGLLQETNALLSELVASPDVCSWLRTQITQMVSQSMAALTTSTDRKAKSKASMDLCFLVRLLPMVSTGLPQVLSQLISIVSHCVENRMHSFGAEVLALELTACHVSGMVLQSMKGQSSSGGGFGGGGGGGGGGGVSPGGGNSVDAATDVIAADVIRSMVQAALTVCDFMVIPTPYPVIIAICALLFQAADTLAERVANGQNAASMQIGHVIDALQKVVDSSNAPTSSLPMEAYVLLLCTLDKFYWSVDQSATIATSLVQQFGSLAASLEGNLLLLEKGAISPGYAQVDNAVVSSLSRCCAAMNSLARAHSLSKPASRQALTSSLLPLVAQGYIEKCLDFLIRIVLRVYETQLQGSSAHTLNSAIGSVMVTTRLLLSTICGFLQSLGKKSFGKPASEALMKCVILCETSNALFSGKNSNGNSNGYSNGSNGSGRGETQLSLLFDGSTGLALAKQMLELAQVLAITTPSSSSSAAAQVEATFRLLVDLSSGLGHETVCTELLQHILKTGNIATSCYWQKSTSNLRSIGGAAAYGAVAAIAAAGAGFDSNAQDDSTGVNVQPIVTLLTQLCVGSLGPSVPPQDALTALEGMVSLSDQHQIFAVGWFQNTCWLQLLTTCLRAVLLGFHSIHRDTLDVLLSALTKAGLAAYVGGVASVYLPDDQYLPKASEFWSLIARETVGICSEVGCGDFGTELLTSALQSRFSAGSNRQVAVAFDMKLFTEAVLMPLAIQISRTSNSS